MKPLALILVAALALAACAAPEPVGQCEPGVADIAAQAAVVPCS
ncbi:MAG TPA: hypothetical protein VLA78_10780 [Paracoccaceae bacterium]|nr:hypothetical protein [Paracoccaceae bacterium]